MHDKEALQYQLQDSNRMMIVPQQCYFCNWLGTFDFCVEEINIGCEGCTGPDVTQNFQRVRRTLITSKGIQNSPPEP